MKVKKRKMAAARAILKTAIWPVRWMKYCKMVYLILSFLYAPFELVTFVHFMPYYCIILIKKV